jgi:hypothetical protein
MFMTDKGMHLRKDHDKADLSQDGSILLLKRS